MYLSLFKSVLFAAALTAASMLSAQVPQLLNYQGRVAVGASAVYFEGTGAFKFALVDADGITSYWSNDGTSYAGSEPSSAVDLLVAKGVYSVLLGDESLMQPISHAVFANSDVHLRVWFDDGVNGSQLLTPDRRIAAVGYAMVAGGVQPGVDISAGTVTATSFSGDGSGLTNLPAVATPPLGMVLIPEGAFTMGDSIDGNQYAVPISTTVSAFYMDATEVTLSQWQSVYYWATSNGYTDLYAGSGDGPNHPVGLVSWYDCVKWCNARSEQAGLTPVYYTDDAQTIVYRTGEVDVTNAQVNWSANGYRLPTEAEWEKAARGGLSGQRFPWGNTISQNLANYAGNTGYPYDDGPDGYNGNVEATFSTPSPVGSFAANGYGLYDMAGNIWEWCWDWYGSPYAGGTDPKGPPPDAVGQRVVRDGGGASSARCASRDLAYANNAYGLNIGFRTVLAPGQ